MLKMGAHESCAPCSISDAHSAQDILTKHSRSRMPHPTTTRDGARERSSSDAVAECAPQRGAAPPRAKETSRQAAPRAEAVYARGARGRRRSRLTRAAAQYTAEAAGVAVSVARRARGGAASGPGAQRSGGGRAAAGPRRAAGGGGVWPLAPLDGSGISDSPFYGGPFRLILQTPIPCNRTQYRC